MSFAATWMDLEIIILSEVNQREKDKCHMMHLYVESKNNELIYRNRLRDIGSKLQLPKGKEVQGQIGNYL